MITRCIGFVEDQISGYQLIQRSGVEYQAQTFGSMGSAICQLDYEPSPVPPDCFGSGAYWQYSRRQAGGWRPSTAGASSSMLQDGDLDGWRYAAGSGQTPPNMSFAAICGAPAATAGPAASHSVTTSIAPRAVATAPPSSAQSPTPAPSPSLEAIAPTASPTQRAALTATGPTTRPPPSSPLGTWLLLVGATALLLGLGVVNLLRRGP